MPGQIRRDATRRRHLSLAPRYLLAFALTVASATAQAVVADAGADQTLPDSDRQPGELVTLRGSGSVPQVSIRIPPGHVPDAGQCRIWIPGVPPGRQLPPVPCLQIGPIPLGA